jgi:hypothetical protein
MIRFSAGEEEIAGLFRFLKRRAPENKLLLVPLSNDRRDRRLRRSARPLIAELASRTEGTRWGIYTALDHPEPSTRGDVDSCLIILQLGPADAEGHREALLEARDEMTPDRRMLTRRSQLARSLVERSARRLRRRGTREKGRWVISE